MASNKKQKEKRVKSSSPSGKREPEITKPEYYMAVAKLSEHRSKDAKTQVGACIVNKDERIVSTGYNGMPNKCNDLPWTKGKGLKNKHLYVCHAEMNAICNAHADVSGFTLYTTLFPCNECAKIIIQSRIAEVVYEKYNNPRKFKYKASEKMLIMAGVTLTCRPFRHNKKKIRVQLDGFRTLKK